jgi:hypothetical protein
VIAVCLYGITGFRIGKAVVRARLGRAGGGYDQQCLRAVPVHLGLPLAIRSRDGAIMTLPRRAYLTLSALTMVLLFGLLGLAWWVALPVGIPAICP